MKTSLTANRLIHAINNSIEGYEASDALKILRTDFGFTDFEILQLGLKYLFHLAEEDEPEKKTWKVHVRETFEGDFEVEAADYDEAYDLACDLNYSLEDLGYTDCDLDVTEA